MGRPYNFILVPPPEFAQYPRSLTRMNSKYLSDAMQRIPNTELLINVVSRRVRQLAQGHRPMIQVEPRMDPAEIALKEITEGKLGFELVESDIVFQQSK